jgi:hypothetical protein
MKPALGGLAVLAAFALAVPAAPTRPAAADEPPPAPAADALAFSAISAVLEANGGQPPATGEHLALALRKVGRFAHLPIPFSAVQLDSGLANPRVVITPLVAGLSTAEPNRPNLDGRLFFAVNMGRPREVGGDPRVTSVEFISWNTRRKRFDFGVIDNMGATGTPPELRVVDGGRCFSCHKNRGPVLGADPWSNTAHDELVRIALTDRLRLTPLTPTPGRLALAVVPRTHIDGMALAAADGPEVDFGVRLGAALRLNREVFRVMNRTPAGRKAFVTLLVAVVGAAPLDPKNPQVQQVQQAVDAALSPSLSRVAADWVALQKGSHPGILADFTPAGVSLAGSRLPPASAAASSMGARRPQQAGGKWGGGGTTPPPRPTTPAEAQKKALDQLTEQAVNQRKVELAKKVALYDEVRANGLHGLPSAAQPSNPRAFLPLPAVTPTRASGMVNPVMLASTIGLTEGDRQFLAGALADAAKRVRKKGVTASTLARQVFEGGQFADVLAGGPLPDRDEFKDRFVTGLDDLLKANHGLSVSVPADRRLYASGPRADPAADEPEAEVVPTTACLRCHEVRGPVKAPVFDQIPVLAFDPFDKAGREAWLATTPDRKERRQVLERMTKRLFEDKDMPPEDAAEHERFRVGAAATFDEAKGFLDAELKKVKGK